MFHNEIELLYPSFLGAPWWPKAISFFAILAQILPFLPQKSYFCALNKPLFDGN